MKKILSFFIAILFVFLFAAPVSAERIKNFNVDLNANKDSSIKVVEEIEYDFEGLDRHGIFRYIPLYSKVGDLYRVIKLTDVEIKRDGKNEKYSVKIDKEQITFKIGDPDKTINGSHVYTVSYVAHNAVGSNFPDHDEIYWNATGNGWVVPIDRARVTIGTSFEVSRDDLICFTGYLGATDRNCEIEENAVVANGLLENQGLTIVAVYPVNTFADTVLNKELPKTFAERFFEVIFKNLHLIFLFFNVILPLFLLNWYSKNKNKKKYGPPAVNFDLPEDESGKRIAPAIAGTIDTSKLERDDVTATLFDLAIRKYIRLEETKVKKKVLGVIDTEEKDQIIRKLKEKDEKMEDFEKKLFDRLFKDGDVVKTKDLQKDFYLTFQEMEEEVFKSLVERKYYTKNPKTQKALFGILGAFALFSFNFILGVTLLFLAKKLNGRTAKGDSADHKIDGLKLFLKSMDRNYKWQAEKFYVVEHMIPYAMAVGLIDKFMEQLKLIKPDYNPTWYRGYTGATFYSSYSGFYSSVSSNITTSAPSSSSGFSGGSSGGGGGGGGGGSW